MYQVMTLEEQRGLAREMLHVILTVTPEPILRSLLDRIRRLGENVRDEVQQYRALRHACLEYQPLAVALADLGYPRLDETGPYEINADIGRVVQVFNRAVEAWLEEDAEEGPPIRHRLVIVPDPEPES